MISTLLYTIKRFLINSYCLLVDVVCLPLIWVRSSKNTRNKILVIKTDNIGDFILWTDAAKEYKTIYPADKYEITLLGNSIWTDLAKQTGYFDVIIDLDRKKFMLLPFYRIKKMKQVVSYHWHHVIYHSFSHEYGTGLSILKQIKSEKTIAGPSDNGIDNRFWRNMVKKKITVTPTLETTSAHELKKNAAFIRSLGHKHFKDDIPDLKYLSRPLHFQLPPAYYVIFPGASSPARKWSAANFTDLCNYIYERTGWTGILCGSKGEVTFAESIVNSSKAKLISIAGKTNLQEFLFVLEHAKLVVTNETSCTHMAASVDVTTICILGGGHFGRFLPFPQYNNRKIPISIYHQMNCFHCNWNCIYRSTKFQAAPCIENISLKQVIQIINPLLEEV